MKRRIRNFLDGAGTILSITPPSESTERLPRTRAILEQSDEDAIRGDWEAVGRDLQAAMETAEILNDPKLMAQIRASEEDIEAGRVHDLDDVVAELDAEFDDA